jgi:hypothetical protein
MIFDVFYEKKYNQVWPGIVDESKSKQELSQLFEPIFYKCFNTIVTRCFGWGLPKTSLIPFADCINHHNVDSTYEFICRELHEPIKHMSEKDDTYSLDVNQFIEDNKQMLGLDNPEDIDDQTYYTKSKMCFDISDLYLGDDENESEDRTKENHEKDI